MHKKSLILNVRTIIVVRLYAKTNNMKSRIIIAVLTVLFLGSAQNAAAQQKINFSEDSWNKIMDTAQRQNKVIFVDAYTSWCGPCKLLQKTTFSDQIVQAYFNENFINASYDMEQGEGKLLAKKWKVEAYPTLLFIDKKGKILKTIIGLIDTQALLNIAKTVKQ
jgi:thioredoxin 1